MMSALSSPVSVSSSSPSGCTLFVGLRSPRIAVAGTCCDSRLAYKLENVTFNGTALIDVSGHTTFEIGGSVSSGVTVNFEVANGDSGLILDNPSDFHGVVEGLVEASSEGAENYIDLKGFADTTQTHVTSAVFNSSTDVTAVTITNGTNHLTIDLSGDYRSGDIEFATDHAGGTLFSDPAANSGAVTIDSGTTLDIAAASTATVSFANGNGNTGELVLADSKDFTGTIVGFTGDGTISNSDLVDLADVNIANVALNKTTYTDHGNDTGTLTLYNANGQALDSINLSGTYQLANFTIENDGDGGTLIVDPPVNTNGQSSANTHMASNQNPTGTQAADGFAFNFTGPHHAPTTDFHPDLDAFRLGGPMLTNLHTASNAAPDQGNFNMSLEARATIISASPDSARCTSTAPTSISCERGLQPCAGQPVILVVTRAVALLMADLTVLLQPDLPA